MSRRSWLRRRSRHAPIPFLKTDGTDWHDSPIRDCRVECPVCGYIGGSLVPHRKHPNGGWEKVEFGDYGDGRLIVWQPPPDMGRVDLRCTVDLIETARSGATP